MEAIYEIDLGSCAGKINSDQTAKNRVGQAAISNAKIVASGDPLMNWEEIEKEVAARRGDEAPDDGQGR